MSGLVGRYELTKSQNSARQSSTRSEGGCVNGAQRLSSGDVFLLRHTPAFEQITSHH